MSLSLLQLLDWTTIAQVVGLENFEAVTPLKVPCPVCKSARFFIYKDTTDDSLWHYCHNCKLRGDMLQLISSIEMKSVETIVTELKDRGFPGFNLPKRKLEIVVQKYFRRTSKLRKARETWLAANPAIFEASSAVATRVRKFRWGTPPKLEDGFDTTQLVRWMPHRDITAGMGIAVPNNVRRNRSGYDGTMKFIPRRFDSRWSDVVMFPYEKLPGLLSGFLCIGGRRDMKDGSGLEKFTSVMAPYRHSLKENFTDAGLWGLPTLSEPEPVYGDVVLAFDNPITPMRMQYQHLLLHFKPLPIVSWLFKPKARTEQTAWQATHGKKVVIVTLNLTPSVLYAAFCADAHICVLNSSPLITTSMYEHTNAYRPLEFFERVTRRAIYWRDLLDKFVKRNSNATVKELLMGLMGGGLTQQQVGVVAGTQYQEFLTEHKEKSVTVLRYGKNWQVYETKGGWYIQRVGRGELQHISDTVFRVTEIAGTTPITIKGYVQYKEHKIPFTCTEDMVLNADTTCALITRLVVQAGYGVPRLNVGDINPYQISRLFHEPRIVA